MSRREAEAMFERAAGALGWMPARLVVADGFVRRLFGMTVRPPVDACGTPLVMCFPACSSVHTCFMRYALDVAFIDGTGEVLVLRRGMPPWRVTSAPGAFAVLERASCLRDEDPVRRADSRWNRVLPACRDLGGWVGA